MNLLNFSIGLELNTTKIPKEALLSALIQQADPTTLSRLRTVFPKECAEVSDRHASPSGVLVRDGVPSPDSVQAGRLAREFRKKAREFLKAL